MTTTLKIPAVQRLGAPPPTVRVRADGGKVLISDSDGRDHILYRDRTVPVPAAVEAAADGSFCIDSVLGSIAYEVAAGDIALPSAGIVEDARGRIIGVITPTGVRRPVNPRERRGDSALRRH